LSRKKLADFLKKRGVNAEIIDTGEETPTVIASSEVLGLSRKKIAKSIIFKSDIGIIVTIMRGDQRVNERRLAQVLGAKNVLLADPKTVKEATGYDVGGVPPVGHDNQDNIIYVMDSKLLKCDVVYAGGGDRRAQLSIRVKDIIQIVNPKIADITE
jgi:Cys-tRNA(Pro) deacylase